jgi:hypothetical protein
MALSGALTLALALAAGAGDDRLLLCRPRLLGDPALARGEAVIEAARRHEGRFLDYGVACEDAAEGARAARRAGLSHAVAGTAEGKPEGSRFVLVLTEAGSDAVRAQRAVLVLPGEDAVRPLRKAFGELVEALPTKPGPRPGHVAAWSVAGAGAAAIAAGVVFAISARNADRRADSAADSAAYARANEQWKEKKKWSAVSLGVGGAALTAGLVWRVAF